jgi:serine/threonine protein kinase
VHRDVKPSNVLLETSGRVVLTDFGIATYDGATTLTQTGTFMGSPAYVAPEVARGGPASPASDLWSLGATLYAAVEGRPPYDYETAMATLSALVTSEPDPPLRAGPLRPVLAGLLTKEPDRRLTADRAAELLNAAAAPPAPPRPARPDRPVHRRIAARVGVVPVITVAVLALAIGAGVLAGVKGSPARYSGDPSPRTASSAQGSPGVSPTPGGPLPATIGGAPATRHRVRPPRRPAPPVPRRGHLCRPRSAVQAAAPGSPAEAPPGPRSRCSPSGSPQALAGRCRSS